MLHDVSKARYRVDLSNDPTEIPPCQWAARIFDLHAEQAQVGTAYGTTREGAFSAAQDYISRLATPREAPSSVYVGADGAIIDPHDA